MRAIALAAAWLAVAAPAVAHAEPVAPQPGARCPAVLVDALTRASDQSTVLRCGDTGWQVVDDPHPHSDRWFSYGPALVLHGEAQRNREADSGDWLATPQDSASRCTAVQTAIADTGSLGPPQTSAGEPGAPFAVEFLPLLFTVDLSGDCLWVRR
ncbi:hypothetical protein [Mycobacterium deserti]|uniref:Secreted protein n=1 Tax=Mycobacterium deserti TaxID=2978347 RepID=A0ABT2M921_9MYCO|nr:hypothetical protein [Mycobacterium deserti]MCT7658754.1 hypothetical protein [Mycobacterium deserti]